MDICPAQQEVSYTDHSDDHSAGTTKTIIKTRGESENRQRVKFWKGSFRTGQFLIFRNSRFRTTIFFNRVSFSRKINFNSLNHAKVYAFKKLMFGWSHHFRITKFGSCGHFESARLWRKNFLVKTVFQPKKSCLLRFGISFSTTQ